MDEAQQRIRNLSPITISISLKNIKADIADKDLHKCLLNWRLPLETTTPIPSIPMAGGPAGLLINPNEDNADDLDYVQSRGELAEFNKIQFFIVQPPRWCTLTQENVIKNLRKI